MSGSSGITAVVVVSPFSSSPTPSLPYVVSSLVGSAMVFLCLLFAILNIVVIRTMLTSKELIRYSSYKFMIALGVSDLVQLSVHFATGIFTIVRVHESSLLKKSLGALITPAYVFYSTLTIVLAVNRLVLTISPPLELWMFSQTAMKLWIGACASISSGFVLALASPYASILYTWTQLSWEYDHTLDYSWLVEEVEMFVEVIGIFLSGLLYLLIFLLIAYKRSANSIKRTRRDDKKILYQSFFITTYCTILNIFWHKYKIFFPDTVIGYATLNFLWIGNSAINPIVYIIVNVTLRQRMVFNLTTTQKLSSQGGHTGFQGGRTEATRALPSIVPKSIIFIAR